MKLVYAFSLAALLAACAVTPTVKRADCTHIESCVMAGNIAVLAEDSIADPILETAHKGALSFHRYFGVVNAPIAIVPGGVISPELDQRLKIAGYEVSLPWISATDKKTLAESQIRQQVQEQTTGMSPEQQEAIIKSALARIESPSSSNSMSDTEQGALTHELGHLWFKAAFKSVDEEAVGEFGYGSWAPDWLDETAAILLENETLMQKRRAAFKTLPLTDFYPLEDFLKMEHPSLKSAEALTEEFGLKTGGGNRAIVLSGEKAEAFLKASKDSDPINFYRQVRGFADYVINATGNERIFATLAQHLGQGKSFETWLLETEGLPNDMESLNDDWNEFIAKRSMH